MSDNTISEVMGLQSAPDDLTPLDPLSNPEVCGGTYCHSTYSSNDVPVQG
jgi:hypothetical protein